MADELPTFESMFRKSKGLDLAEEAPSEEESTPSEKQRSRVYDKLTDEDGNSRLKHKANVPALENYDQDIYAPQGEVHDADKLKATRKSAGIREMIARECFEKTGRIPDVDFMDTYEVKKAYSSMDYGDYSGAPDIAPPAKYPTDEFDEGSNYMEPWGPIDDDPGEGEEEEEEDPIDLDSRDPTSPKTPARYRDYYKNPAEMNAVQNVEAFLSDLRKEKRAEDAKQMRPPDNRVQTKLEAFAPGGTGLMRRQIKKADTSDASEGDVSFRAMLAYRTFQKSGRTPDVDFFESDYFQKAAIDAESDTPIQDREARRQIGRTAPRLVEGMSSLNDGAPLTDTDGQEIGQMAGASSASRAYDTDDFTMEDAALKNENALEKALRGYLDSNPNITIEDLEKFIESSKGGFRVGVEKPFL